MYNNNDYPNYCTVLPLSMTYTEYAGSSDKQEISINLNSFEVSPNTSATISATYTYANGSSVNGVTTVFKVNGITIGSAKINNGKASLTFDVPNWKLKDYTLMAKVGATSNNYEAIQYAYNSAGYVCPQIVFWNVNGRVNNVPVTIHNTGTALISGASPSIIKAVLTNDLNPISIMNKVIQSERYNLIR
jgi:hypothetical protein